MPATAFPGGIEEKGYNFYAHGRFHDVTVVQKPRKPDTTRKVLQINYAWNHRGNWPGFKSRDHFYVRWSGYIEIKTAGRYYFFTNSDDGSRLSIDGNLLVSGFPLPRRVWGHRHHHGLIDNMKAGKHAFWAEYFEGGGWAGMSLMYNGPDTGNKKVVIPTSALSSSLKASGKMMLTGFWKKQGGCAAYSSSGSQCIIYTSCDATTTSEEPCGDTNFDFVGPVAGFKTCKYPPLKMS